MPILTSPFASLDLLRQPEQANEPLQAFDAADEYLLGQLHADALPAEARVLIINDSFGALAASLAPHARVSSWGDSHLAHLALLKNLARNQLPADAVHFIPASEPVQGLFDRVLIRVPKTLALLEEQLIGLHGHLAPGARWWPAPCSSTCRAPPVICWRSTSARCRPRWRRRRPACSRPCPPSARRRARPTPPATTWTSRHWSWSTTPTCSVARDWTSAPAPSCHTCPKGWARHGWRICGCGNGVLGIACALANPQAQLTLVDESYMAVRSARENWQAALGERAVTIRADDGLAGQPSQSLDLVLCNPPFHQQQVVGDFLAWRMFQQAREALVNGGELWIVGNRHLGYHVKLKRLFSRVEQVAATPKFVILRAMR